jgi:hypothetical protein
MLCLVGGIHGLGMLAIRVDECAKFIRLRKEPVPLFNVQRDRLPTEAPYNDSTFALEWLALFVGSRPVGYCKR